MKRFIIFPYPKVWAFFCGLLCTLFAVFTVLAENETPLNTLTWCESLAFGASEMAYKARVTGDYPTAYQALNLANEAAYFVSEVSRVAQDTANPQLALSAYNVSNEVEAAIANVVRAADHIASHSQNPDEVHAANFLLESCEVARRLNKVIMETALVSFSGISEWPEAYSK